MPGAARGPLAIILVSLLAGCATFPDHPPAFAVEDVRFWFEGEFLVVNVTLANRSNATLGGPNALDPEVWVTLEEWRARVGGGREPGDDLDYVMFETTALLFSGGGDDPPKPRYLSRAARARHAELEDPDPPFNHEIVGPVIIRPNDTIEAEFEFYPTLWYEGRAGYYTILVKTFGAPEGWARRDRYQSGCFNRDTPEFYGVREGGPDCLYWDLTGEKTDYGVAVGLPLHNASLN